MNLDILAEERPSPKTEVLRIIIAKSLHNKKIYAFMNLLKILPIVKKKYFTFSYEVLGVSCNGLKNL